MNVDVVTFGEAMLRLAPPAFHRIEQAMQFDVRVGGAELNVAVALSRLGCKSRWVSRLTDNPLGYLVRNEARKHGVDTDFILWTPEDRVGLYFFEFGASPRPSSVLYDRAHSAISRIQPGMIDWDQVFQGARLFHCSGITPALSPGAAAVTMDALKAAHAAGCKVSYDLNYRSKLWSAEEAERVQRPMMEYVDILITTEEDTRKVFGIEGDPSVDEGTFSSVSTRTYADVARKLGTAFGFDMVAITLRENRSVWKNTWGAVLWHQDAIIEGPRFEVEIVDRLGGGDSFSAGFIFGLLEKDDPEYALRFGNAFSALAHSIPGDFNYATRQEVESLLKGGGVRVRR